MTIAIGKPNYSGGGSGFERPTFYKLGHKQDKDRVLIARIAPPLGSLAEKGVWARFIKQHFGYTITIPGRNGGPNRTIPVTFDCIEERDRDKNIKQRCPECDEIASQKAKVEAKTKEMKAAGKSDEEIDTALRFLKSWLKDHNLDKKWNMVAKDTSGRWGFLTISHSCYKLLKGNSENQGLIDRLVSKGKDPLGVVGLWFKFTRSGVHFSEIKDIPEVLMEESATEPGSYKMKLDELLAPDFEQLEKLPGLNTLGRPLSYAQIEQLVNNGGDEEIVRLVMNMPRTVGSSHTTTATPGPAPVAATAPIDDEDEPLPPAEVKTTSPSAAQSAAPEVDAEEAALQAQLAAIKAKKAAAATAAVAKPAVTPAVATVPAKIASDLNAPLDDFLAKFGNTKA